MSKLKARDPKEAKPSKPKILVFGKAGVGKTWTALDFPSVYYIDTEGGADLAHYTDKLKRSGGVYMGVEDGSLVFKEVIEQVKALCSEKHQYKTLVIDSITKLFLQTVAEEADRLGDKNAFGADKKPAIGFMRQLCSWLTKLDMNVILIAHEKPMWGLVNGERSEIGVTYDCWDKLEYELHLSLNIQKRGLSRVAVTRKTRLTGFPESEAFTWSYDEFATRYGKDIIEGEAKVISLATPEQVKQVKSMLEIVKVAEEDIAKGFSKAQVEDWSDMTSEQIDVWIKFLTNKMKGK